MDSALSALLAAALVAAPTLPGSFEPLKADLPNFEKVHPWLLRGAQPSETGLGLLAGMGVKTVVDLREEEPELAKREKAIVEKLGMSFVALPMSGTRAPKDEQVQAFRALFEDWNNFPIFVHCRRGADRTGALIAAYRIDFDGWKVLPAVREMLGHGALQPALIAWVFSHAYKADPPPYRKRGTEALEGIGGSAGGS